MATKKKKSAKKTAALRSNKKAKCATTIKPPILSVCWDRQYVPITNAKTKPRL